MNSRFYVAGLLATGALASHAVANQDGPFERVASFPVFLNTDVDDETVAEIITASEDGMTLIYTDSETEHLGFVDITDPSNPQPAGLVALGGEPTSVAVAGGYALTCINTSADFVNTSGDLLVIDIAARTIVATHPLGGQPDAIAVSPNGQWAAICIENERDEDLGDGEPPQLPAGFLVSVNLSGDPTSWTPQAIDLTGLADLYPEDPEPEFVDINQFNVAIVTMQENNHGVLVYLPTGYILNDFSFGTADLTQVDDTEDDLIEQIADLNGVPREPDAVTWTSPVTLATADEGDLFGGSRGFTTFLPSGHILYEAGNHIEHMAASMGHYPENRSENKGTEPEGIEFGRYGWDKYLFVGSERANLVFVYQLFGPPAVANKNPQLLQVLPTGVGPEGLLAIPDRDLFVVACEVDDRGDKIRSTVMIYERTGNSNYPDLVSRDRGDGTPIAWGALSGLTRRGNSVYTIHDSFYRKSRIYRARGSNDGPAKIVKETVIHDTSGVLATTLADLKANLPGTDDFDPTSLINDDMTVNLDLEGIAAVKHGRFWLASEGRGNLVDGVSDPDDRPFESPNLLVRVDKFGNIEDVVLPPLDVTQNQLRFGFEGVDQAGKYLFVAFQRAWQADGDPADMARIGRYNLQNGTWGFAHYPLESPTSPAGGWVGLSELTHLGGGEFAVIERDNQGGPDAAIKHVSTFSVQGIQFLDASQVANFDVVTKELAVDLISSGAFDSTGGLIPEKLEGMTVLPGGDVIIVNDNDGTDDNSGETRVLRLEDVLD